ncbi:hypothetical protein VHUM_00346 [Vanrija humicola]|uniref:ABC transporter domain-containing protein n=1 Tax=Vanrija humicola TaxID=5417 RepID=A0A7D8Z831_VANHU|nr:hypothetical protein VHUM_00346 [Vanrija humicola]
MRLGTAGLLASLVGLAAAQNCTNYGVASGSNCLCPPGFNSPQATSCAQANCGGNLFNPPAQAAPAPGGNVTSCTTCGPGWSGPTCALCSTGASCQAALGKYIDSAAGAGGIASAAVNSTLTCSKSPTVYSVSQMSCAIRATLIESLFPGDVSLSMTRSLNSSKTPGGPNTLKAAGLPAVNGEVWAQVWYQGREQFYCHASACNQTVSDGTSTSEWVCSELACTCPPGTAFCTAVGGLLVGLIAVVKGPLTVNCDSAEACTFRQKDLDGFFTGGLPLSSCTHGECVQQFVIDQAEGIQAAFVSNGGLSGGVIAGLAVVGAFLLLVLGIIIWGLVARSKARKRVSDGLLEKRGGVGVSWSGVGYEVHAHGRGAYAAIVGWLRGFDTPRRRAKLEAEKGIAPGPNGGKVILQNCYGNVPAGSMLAVLGPSGAGKSTLIDILGGKRKAGLVEGKVAYHPVNNDGRRVKFGFVDQSDVLAPTSTVYETLLFSARLRLPENVPDSVKEERARLVLNQLGLAHVGDTRIGSGEIRGISGGEMRRVSIGTELVAAPDVLVLDEPTSGLDSVSAARLISLLKSLAEDPNQRTTIIASIHQPSSALYQMFTQVLLLAHGQQLYFGPAGHTPVDFFAEQGYPCPPDYNVADHLLDIASEPGLRLRTGVDAMIESSQYHYSRASDHRSEPAPNTSDEKLSPNGATYPPGSNQVDLAQVSRAAGKGWFNVSNNPETTFLTQVAVLSGREVKNLKRDKTLLLAHIVLASVSAVFSGGLYFQAKLTIGGFQNRVGSLFFLASLIAFSALSALANVIEVRPLFLRERASSLYSPQAWLTARLLFDIIPLRLVPAAILGVVVYWMVGLAPSAARFFKFLLILLEFCLSTTLYNFMLAACFSHAGVAILLSSLYNLFLMTYAGFFVNLETIPPVLRWLRYFSTLGYALEALTVNEVGAGISIIDTLNGVQIEINGALIMETLFGFQLGHYYRNVLILVAFILGFLAMLVFCVFFMLREKR